MTTIRLCTILITSFFISSYVIASYGPTGDYGGFPHGGYSDMRTSSNTAVVRYDGGAFTSQKEIENFVLYRCARVTIDSGYNYFVVTSITTSPVVVNVKTRNTHNNYVTIPPKLYTAYPDIESADPESVSVSGTSMRCRYNGGEPCGRAIHGITAVIKMFRGYAPRNIPRAYDATDVIAHLEPQTF